MGHANSLDTNMANPSIKARVAFKDVSNNFNVKCAKHPKAVSHKRNVSTIYSSSMSGSNVANSERNGSPLAKSSLENDASAIPQPRDSKKSVAMTEKASLCTSKPAKATAISRTTSSYQDGPAVDIDARDSDQPLCATTYVQDMYKYFRSQEHRAVPNPNYMDDQKSINDRMRAILLDWLCSLHHKMKCDAETLYLTANIIDRYLAKTLVARNKLQLIGTSALLIASKYEQIYPVDINDLVYVCNDLYTKGDIFEMEEQILKALNYRISIPTIYKFFVRYLNASHADKKLIFLSSFILEESLLSYNMIKYKPSQLAAAAVLIARKAIGRNSWSPTLLKYSEYREEDIIPVARAMIAAKNALPPGLDALRKKFSRNSKFKAANISLPSNL